LRIEAPDSIRELVMLFCGDKVWRSWGELEYSVRTGRPAWEHVTGLPSFEFFAQHPDQAATFNAAMADHTRSVAPAIIAGYDFARFDTLVDVGGGDGILIAAILNATPGMRGVRFDLPGRRRGGGQDAGRGRGGRQVPGGYRRLLHLGARWR